MHQPHQAARPRRRFRPRRQPPPASQGQRFAPRQQTGKEHASRDFQTGAARDEDRRQFECAMRRDESPKLQRHSRLPGCGADHADKHAVGEHHVNRPNPRRNPHRKCREAYGKIVGHDARGSERLDGHNGFCPHLAFLNRGHHLGTKHAVRESGIMNGHGPGGNSRYGENEKREKCLRESFAENPRKSLRIETDEPADFLLVTHVDEVVRASQELIQVKG